MQYVGSDVRCAELEVADLGGPGAGIKRAMLVSEGVASDAPAELD